MGVRISELPETTGINKEDVLIVEDGQGTKKGTVQQLDESLGVSQLKEDLGDKSNLNTDNKTNVVNAINEVNNRFITPVSEAVGDWLNAHPEATTTVQDKSLTYEKNSLDYRNQTLHIIHDMNGDITELIQDIVKSNRHIRIYNCNVTITKGVTFSNINNVVLEFINSSIIYCYDHTITTNQQAFTFENCNNVAIEGLNITTDYSTSNDVNLDIQRLYNNNLYCIWLDDVTKCTIKNCDISQFTDGLSINYSKDVNVYYCKFYNIGQEPAVFRNCSQCSMCFCEAFWHGGDGTIVKHYDSDYISGFVFSDNYFHDGKIVTSGAGGIICGGGFTTNVEGNNTILRDPEYIIVRNNKFIDTEYGVLLAGGSHVIVDGNLVKSKQKSDGNYYTYAALGLDYSSYNLPDTQLYTDIKFINNTVEQASRGIYISKHSDQSVVITHEDILISGNIIKNCNNEAIETNDSLVYGNVFKNVKLIILYNTTFIANKVVGSSSLPQYSRFQANDSNIICNIMDMNGLYLDVRNTKDVSISYNTINTMNSIRVDWTSGYVYFTDNIYSSTPELTLLNNSQDYIVINGEPYKAKLIGGEYYSYTKRYGIVELDFISTNNVTLSKSGTKLGTLPEGYRPITISRHILYTNPSSGAIGVIVRIEIHPSGEVIAIAQDNVSGAPIRGSLTFLAEQNSLNKNLVY